eukprot:TRINITY_DN20606_c0_g1_i1.p1 TRINITY_DN20606_c0_g1~~TRINITY_DN20606_c0_g1_i1.p1  ORF type:complete len:539 (+),score=126.93 TRINITY_DN20606_c0_g1_i1:42-1619(+)
MARRCCYAGAAVASCAAAAMLVEAIAPREELRTAPPRAPSTPAPAPPQREAAESAAAPAPPQQEAAASVAAPAPPITAARSAALPLPGPLAGLPAISFDRAPVQHAWVPPPGPIQSQLDAAGLKCERVKPLRPKDHLPLLSCFDPGRCRGAVVVPPAPPCCCRSSDMSSDGGWGEWLTEHAGPEHIRLTVQSPSEIVMGTQRWVPPRLAGERYTCGASILFFQLSQQREFSARAKCELADGWGVNEKHHNTAHWRNKDVAWLPTYRCQTPPPLVATPAADVEQGRWVAREGGSLKPAPGAKPLRGAEWDWERYGGRRRRFTSEEAARCLRSGGGAVVVQIVGDSQARSVYHAVRQRLTSADVSYDAMRRKVANASDTVAGVQLSYRLDSYLDELPRLADPDVLILGYGAHPASWGQWSYADFGKRVDRVADALCRRRGRTVWFGAPAWPKGKPSHVRNFRVTNPRLGIFNALSRRALRRCESVRHADFFSMSFPQLRLSKDGAHYDKSVVMSVLVDMLLEQVCPR